MVKLADKILALRKRQGMSQEELSEKLNVSRQAVSRWEMGSAQPDASNILQLSKLFEVTADYLLNDDYENDQNVYKTFTAKDIQESGYDTPVTETEGKPKKADRNRIIGLCAAAVGLLGNFTVYVLSRIFQVMVPWISYDESGQKWYHWSGGHEGYSYKYFIRQHGLEFLTAAFWIIALAGLALLFLLPLIRRKGKTVTPSSPESGGGTADRGRSELTGWQGFPRDSR